MALPNEDSSLRWLTERLVTNHPAAVLAPLYLHREASLPGKAKGSKDCRGLFFFTRIRYGETLLWPTANICWLKQLLYTLKPTRLPKAFP